MCSSDLNNQAGLDLMNQMHNLLENDLNVIVYNFVDMLSHARTEMEVLKELAGDEMSYRSITASWFEHSPLIDIIKQLADKKIKVVITTEIGAVSQTAHAASLAEQAERLQLAEQTLESDPFVQTLKREFGATIVPGSVRPI